MMHAALVTIRQLLAEPESFDGKRVLVNGLLFYEREHSAIYDCREDAKALLGVWLNHAATVNGESATRALSRRWVRVEGIFHNRENAGAGHKNGWPAEMTNLTALEQAERSTDDGDNEGE
jgi:hypothetical protein